MEVPLSNPLISLEAFGQNNYSKELEDLDDMITMLLSNETVLNVIDSSNISLIGHSRGGGIATIKASEDDRVTHLISWAGVSNFERRTATIGDLDEWKRDGVKYILNGRTKQQMPHYYQFYEDFLANKERLHIELACKRIEIPHLIAHGIDDPSVKFFEAEALHSWNPKSMLLPIENCDHVFNTKHPWENSELSEELRFLVLKTVGFVKNKIL